MRKLDPETCREWLNLELDGALRPAERRELAAYLASHPELRAVGRELAAMDRLLREERVPVRAGFRGRVMAELPASAWEARHPRSWWLVAALLVVVGGASAALLGIGSAATRPEVPFAGALGAVADLFGTALVAGAGLLAASWKGVGLALTELLSRSAAGIVVFVVGVVFLNLLFLALVRGSARRVTVPVLRDGDPPAGRGADRSR